MNELLPLRDDDFAFIARLLYERAGIRMGEQKRTLISGRLTKRILALGFSSFAAYLQFLRTEGGGEEFAQMLNLLTTNHSYFFREREHFDFLTAQVLAPIRRACQEGQSRELRIWSAGCATGEEAYSIAMTVKEGLKDCRAPVDTGILATDISSIALHEALTAVYPAAKLRELPASLRNAYLSKIDEESWTIRPELQSMVLFKRLNLMEASFPFKGSFDVVFCRNVMIYFDAESRRRLIAALHRVIKPGGYFFIGHSETIQRDDCPFEYVKPSIYRKAG